MVPVRSYQSGQHLNASEIKRGFGRRLTIVIVTIMIAVFSIASTFIILKALQARNAESEKLATAANSLSQALDREVTRAYALLVGLESSPALHDGNLQAFHKQLTETTVPEGAWLTLSSKEKVLLHSRFPFGTTLPSLSDFTPQPAFLERIDTLEFSLTGRVQSIMLNATLVTVNTKVHNHNGEWQYFLTTVLSDQRFTSIMKQQRNPLNLTGAIYDQNNNGIVSVRGEDVVIGPQMAGPVSATLSATPASVAMSGLTHADDPEGIPSLIAFSRSELTQWTVTTSISRADLDGPLFETLRLLAITGMMLMLAGGGALLYLRHAIETPIDLLETSVAEADETVERLTRRLLETQEDEHQRIARELHDSTAQHLVGALLGVMSIENKVSSDKAAGLVMKDVKSSIELALNELRTFSYLLHPRDLGERGLAITLKGFVQGFIERSGLRGEVSIDPAVDDLPFELQRTLLRIVQEALANVYRHAKATYVSVTVEIGPKNLVLTIQDNGQGSKAKRFEDADINDGVGIPSMRGRLIAFGGELTIDISTTGTIIRATIPRGAEHENTPRL